MHLYTHSTNYMFQFNCKFSRVSCAIMFPSPSPSPSLPPSLSYSTIVYEMVTKSRPFPTTPGELIIWEVGSGRCQSLQHMNTGKLKDIVQRCWSSSPEYRPSFKELLSTLEHNVSILLCPIYHSTTVKKKNLLIISLSLSSSIQMSPRACGLNSYFSFSDPGQLARTGLH